jgi:hypothetical protein
MSRLPLAFYFLLLASCFLLVIPDTIPIVILNLPAGRQACFRICSKLCPKNYVGLMDSGPAAGMTKRVCNFLLTAYFPFLSS